MVSDTERKIFGFLGDAFKFLAVHDEELEKMTQEQVTNATLEAVVKIGQ